MWCVFLQPYPYLFYSPQTSSGWFKIFKSPATPKTKIRRILLVDDEPDVAVTIGAVLEESGVFQVDRFHNGATALSIFRPGVYDLALLDIKMPGMDSFELCRKIRDIDNKINVCFLTAADLGYYRETVRMSSMIWEECFIANLWIIKISQRD